MDDIETFASGISAATISYTTKSSVDGGDLDEADTYTIAGVKSNYRRSVTSPSRSEALSPTMMMRTKEKSVCSAQALPKRFSAGH